MICVKSYLAKPFSIIYERVAAKKHECDCCKKKIHKGVTYFNKRGMTSKHKFFDLKYCDPCYSTRNI